VEVSSPPTWYIHLQVAAASHSSHETWMKEVKRSIILPILWNFLLIEEQRPMIINMRVINLPEISELFQMCAVLHTWITKLWSPSCIRLPHIPAQVPIRTIFKELGVHVWVQSDLPWTHVGFWARRVSKIMHYKHNYTHFQSYGLGYRWGSSVSLQVGL